MSWDEADLIARRLAARLRAPLSHWPGRPAAGAVLALDAPALPELDDALLQTLAAVVVTDRTGRGSEALVALRDQLAARPPLTVAAALFATQLDDARAEELPLVVAAPGGAEQAAALLAAGPHGLLLDDEVPLDALDDDARPARVCVVSFELAGMTGGGIGTASTALAQSLARAGHDVTFLFSGWQERGAADDNERWRRHYAERGVRLELLREPGVVTVATPHLVASAAYEVDRWLRGAGPFDVVHAPENMGQAAYAQLAKAHGSAHVGTTFVVGTHGPTRWAAEANRVALTREEFLVNDALERISVEHADVLLGPSRYLHDYLRQRGWRLPRRVHVQPYATPAPVRAESFSVPPAVRARSAARARATEPGRPAGGGDALPRELVFFGRLETRKGVVTLCDALDLLAADSAASAVEVTFLGPIAEVLGQPADAYVTERAARWPWSWRIVSDLDQRGAAELLSRPGVLAVMPSTVDNAPNTVSEAVALAIPLIAGRSGGTGELIAAPQRDAHMFGADDGVLLPPPLHEPTAPVDPRPLAALLRQRLTTAAERPQPSFDPAAVEDAYDRWHRAVARAADEATAAAPADADPLPSLAACVLFDGDNPLLAAQLDALGDDCAVVVADLRTGAATPIPAAVTRGATVVRPQRAGHGAEARTAAVAATDAELIAVVPPQDVPLRRFAAALRGAAAATGADVYACVVLDETDPDARGPADDADAGAAPDPALAAFVPLPAAALAGLSHHAFAVGPYAIRRAALERIGGFAADARADEADHDLLDRAALAGLTVEVIAEPLAAKRRPDRWSAVRRVIGAGSAEPPYDAAQWLVVERPYRAAAAAEVAALLRGARAESATARARLQEQEQSYERQAAGLREWVGNLERTVEEHRIIERELEAANQKLRDDNARLTAVTEEMSQSAGQLLMRAVLKAARRVTAVRSR